MKKQIAAVLAVAFVMSSAATVLAAPVTDLVRKTEFNGDLRIRYDIYAKDGFPDDNINKYRLRLNLVNKISDKVTLNLRFANGENQFGDKDGRFLLDRYYLTYNIPNYNFVIGRQDVKLFDGLAVNSTSWAGTDYVDNRFGALEGLTAKTAFGKVKATAYFGQISDQNAYNHSATSPNKYDTQALAFNTAVEKVNFGLALVEVNASQGYNYDKNFTVFNVNSKLTKDLYLGTEFVSGLNGDKDKAWQAYLAYGALKNAGDVLYEFKYKDVERGALQKFYTDSWKSSSQDYTFWSVGATKRLAKELDGKLYYEDYNYSAPGAKPDEHTTRLELVLRF